jgi:amino acid transporter
MHIHFLEILKSTLGLASGAVIGYAFGLIQDLAHRRHLRLEKEGKFKNAWAVMPGSGQRVAGLLLALVLVQFVCPLLFVDGTQWLVSGGVVVGYGWVLFAQLRQRLRAG